MKTINKYKYLMLLAVVALFTSCSESDDVAVAPASTNIQIVVEPFVFSQAGGLGQEGTNNAIVELGFRLTPWYSSTYRGSDVIITYNGNDYVIPAGDDEVVIGNVNIEYELDPPVGGIPFNGTIMTTYVDMTGTYEVQVANRPSDLVVITRGGINVTATVYGRIPPITAGQLNFLLDWDPYAGNDLDLRLRNIGGSQFDSSLSVSRYEDVALSDSDPDDDYVVNVDPWSTSTSSIAGKMFVRHDDGTLEVFDFDLSGISGETTVVNVNKVTDANGNAVYTVSL